MGMAVLFSVPLMRNFRDKVKTRADFRAVPQGNWLELLKANQTFVFVIGNRLARRLRVAHSRKFLVPNRLRGLHGVTDSGTTRCCN
jgi:hypothetical protein